MIHNCYCCSDFYRWTQITSPLENVLYLDGALSNEPISV